MFIEPQYCSRSLLRGTAPLVLLVWRLLRMGTWLRRTPPTHLRPSSQGIIHAADLKPLNVVRAKAFGAQGGAADKWLLIDLDAASKLPQETTGAGSLSEDQKPKNRHVGLKSSSTAVRPAQTAIAEYPQPAWGRTPLLDMAGL